MQDFQADLDAIAQIGAIPKILDVVCRSTGMGFAAVARVTADRWITCAVKDDISFGLVPGSELAVETTICDEIREGGQAVVIDHVAEDPEYRDHHTPRQYGFQSYISMPIKLANGEFFGTLCAIDPKPARLKTPETIGMFQLFADLIALHLENQRSVALSNASLFTERETGVLREQFIAVLGHDLRNPLAAIDSGARMLLDQPLDERGKTIVEMMLRSSRRMQDLIENVLDFARARLGGGIEVRKSMAAPIAPVLEQVLAEIRVSHPDREIQAHFDVAETLSFDRQRLGQLFSNLLGNAIMHGATGEPVVVDAHSDALGFELSVANSGDPIPALSIPTIFKPFVRASNKRGQQGLGLGLYIASTIAEAHGGTLAVTSSPALTRFTFRMPNVDAGARSA